VKRRQRPRVRQSAEVAAAPSLVVTKSAEGEAWSRTWEATGVRWRLVPAVNESGSVHWSELRRRAKTQRKGACVATWAAAGVQRLRGGECATVTITRLSSTGRKLDTDNLAGSAKHIRDGIADALGVDDGSDRYTWRYGQEAHPIRGAWGVRVTIEISP
jgi:crossover junction endodeoxyribonuclease RusA